MNSVRDVVRAQEVHRGETHIGFQIALNEKTLVVTRRGDIIVFVLRDDDVGDVVSDSMMVHDFEKLGDVEKFLEQMALKLVVELYTDRLRMREAPRAMHDALDWLLDHAYAVT